MLVGFSLIHFFKSKIKVEIIEIFSNTQKGSKKPKHKDGLLFKIFEKFYAPFLLSPPVRIAVLIGFLVWLGVSIILIPDIEVGLDQQLSMPGDSYVLTYFDAMLAYLSVGPPVYFVIKNTGFPYHLNETTQDLVRAGQNPYSLVSQVYSASRASNTTYIAKPAASWLDDYRDWAGAKTCCYYKGDRDNRPQFCPSINPG